MKNLLLRVTRDILSKISVLLEKLNYRVQVRIFALYKQIKPNNIKKLRERADCVIRTAKQYSQTDSFTQDEQNLAYYYYLIKHYTAVYESYFGLVPPIQIFNEHRMALDHIIRAKDHKHRAKNIEKATNHILRGLLDILKLSCAELKTTIQTEHNKYPPKVWGLVSDGEYIKNFFELQNTAENSMCDAKCSDYRLSGIDCQDTNIVDKFIYALEAHNEWRLFQIANRGKATISYAWYHIIKGSSFAVAVGIGLCVNYLWSHKDWLLNFILGMLRRLTNLIGTNV